MVKQCIANITYGSNCDQHLGTYTGEGTGDKVKISPVGRVVGVDEYCFLVNATSNHITVFIQGNLQNLGILLLSMISCSREGGRSFPLNIT